MDEYLPEIPSGPGFVQTEEPPLNRGDSSISYGPSNPELATFWGYDSWDGGLNTPLSNSKALTLSTFFGGIYLAAEAVSTVEFGVYKQIEKDKFEYQDQHPVNNIFQTTPNGWQDSYGWKSMIMSHLMLSGNSASFIRKNGRGQAVELSTYLPVNTRYYVGPTNLPIYGLRDYPLSDSNDVTYLNGSRSPDYTEYFHEEVFHPKALSLNGYTGMSILRQAREGLTLSRDIENFGKSFFSKSRPTGFITKEGRLGPKAKEQLEDEWDEWRKTKDNQLSIGVLSGGLKWVPMGYNNNDSQFLDSRNFQVLEVCRWLRMPPALLGFKTSTDPELEILILQLLNFCVMPWADRICGEANLKLFTPRERAMGFQLRPSFENFLRCDTKTTTAKNESEIRHGITTIDEIRWKRGQKLYEDGIGAMPLVMASQLDTLKNVIEGKSALQGQGPEANKKPTKAAV